MCWEISVIPKPSKTQHSAGTGQGTPSSVIALAGPRISKPWHFQGLCWALLCAGAPAWAAELGCRSSA